METAALCKPWKNVVLEENWQVLVVFPPFAQRLENSVSRACWPGSMSTVPTASVLQPTIWTSERGADIRKVQPRPHLPIYRRPQKLVCKNVIMTLFPQLCYNGIPILR